jgi:hypothetical protein
LAEGGLGIVCFGRGIERVRCGDQLVWKSTAYLEKLSDNKHSGYRTEQLSLESGDEDVVVAGAYANMMATAELFKTLGAGLIMWAAGRPDYLKDEPETVSEGSILFEEFKQEVGPALLDFYYPTIRIQANNKNTRDDLLESLALARKMKVSGLIVVSVFVHLPRIVEFYRCALRADPSLSDISVRFAASELVLLGLGDVVQVLQLEDPNVQEKFEHALFSEIVESAAYRRTVAREARGIRALKEGRY